MKHTARAIHIDAADSNDPPRHTSDDTQDVAGLLTGAENDVDDDVRLECPDLRRRIRDGPAIAGDVSNGGREDAGRTPTMEDSDLLVAANEIRDHPRTDEPGAPDYQNAHQYVDTETGLRVPPIFLVRGLPATSRLPSSAEEGWLRGKKKVAKPP